MGTYRENVSGQTTFKPCDISWLLKNIGNLAKELRFRRRKAAGGKGKIQPRMISWLVLTAYCLLPTAYCLLLFAAKAMQVG